MMGDRARLDIVEYPSELGGPAAYDVSVVTASRKGRRFVQECARTPGYAASHRHEAKLHRQYPHRAPGPQLYMIFIVAH